MPKYKIRPYRSGTFKVWVLTNVGNGYMWDDVKTVFQSEEAKKYIEEQKRGGKNGESKTVGCI
jgi:hypothetical protein